MRGLWARLCALLTRCLRPFDPHEAYLARATDLADLERRLRQLHAPRWFDGTANRPWLD